MISDDEICEGIYSYSRANSAPAARMDHKMRFVE